MSLLTLIMSTIVFAIIIVAIFWVGIYVVLPIVLFFMLVSAVVSLIRDFIPEKREKRSKEYRQKNDKNQIIDVEFEEIK